MGKREMSTIPACVAVHGAAEVCAYVRSHAFPDIGWRVAHRADGMQEKKSFRGAIPLHRGGC